MTFTTPLFRRHASSGVDHHWTRKDAPKGQGEANGDNLRDPDGITRDPNYGDDGKTGYIPEHDLTRRHWTGGRNK